ncbi:VanZ family protein [Paenibacillus xerothermodurans]|uniref:VanZ family protein n=1 Tax=Paenibacillus xerothermodurans TaxID=1977292 RepID=A0A2W1NC69_PAEXE|nr:VanZ family protein [Paenibacillus xerothermodurans]PZE22067.1 VanZ family protein [Paenibacillus xerothermodurans]
MPSALRKQLLSLAAWISLISYSLFMMYWLFIGFSREHRSGYMYNLIPFKTINNYITEYHHYNFHTWAINLFGNVAAFMPFGFLVPLLFPRFAKANRLTALFLLVLVLIEALQFAAQVGSFDVDDIILNMVGVWLGTIPHVKTRLKRRQVRPEQGRGNNTKIL